MNAVLTLLAAAAAATSPVAASAPYPGAGLLGAFRQACVDLSSIDTATANARKAGWQDYVPDKESQEAKLLEFGFGAAEKLSSDDATFKTDIRTLRIVIDGHAATLMLTDVTSVGTASIGCRVVDFEATKPLTEAEISGFVRSFKATGRKPSQVDAPGIMNAKIWRPGLFQGHSTTQIAFVPQDSQMKQSLHLSGINLMTQKRN